MSDEIWKDIKWYKGFYKISNLGRVKSLKRKKVLVDKILKHRINEKGYETVHLYKNKKNKTIKVHRLVAKAFISNKKTNLRSIILIAIKEIITLKI